MRTDRDRRTTTGHDRMSVRSRSLVHRLICAVTALVLSSSGALPAMALSRIKDIVDFEGIRDNMLVGYGLVVGLNGTGDTLNQAIFTRESLIGMLERLGVNARDNALRTNNVAAVMVTATLPPFARQGARIDVTVSTLGNSKSLLGGTLLVTPLLGADGEVYAVGAGQRRHRRRQRQGPGRLGDQGRADRRPRRLGRHRRARGRLRARQAAQHEPDAAQSRFHHRAPRRRGDQCASPRSGGARDRSLDRRAERAGQVQNDVVGLLTDIEQLRVEPDEVARVVIDEANGIIVMGESVRISTVAVAQGNLTVRDHRDAASVAAQPLLRRRHHRAHGQQLTDHPARPERAAAPPGGVQFAPSGGAQTVVVPRTNIQVDEQNDHRMAVLPAGVSLQELVDGLNALGVGPRDMINILQAIKAAGALQADIELM